MDMQRPRAITLGLFCASIFSCSIACAAFVA
nr:MAG TPA: Mature oligodendrocyte transmembrane protein [Caudoviricetes sp.]